MKAVFLGAGAGKPFGYPLTGEILPEIVRRLHQKTTLFGSSNSDRDSQNQLIVELKRIVPGYARVDYGDKQSSVPSITDVLSLIDYSLQTAVPVHGLSPAELARTRELLDRAIINVVETGEAYEEEERDRLDTFVQWLKHLAGSGLTVLSTNYDIAIERELLWDYTTNNAVSKDFDFGIVWRDPHKEAACLYGRPAKPKFRVYKLHGSLNWLRCDLCQHIYINCDGEITDRAFQGPNPYNTCHCGHARLRTLLVAPSLVRSMADSNLQEIWRHSLEALRTADEWYIIGYSLPPEDVAVRSLLLRAYNAHARKSRDIPKITVIQYDNKAMPQYKFFFPTCKYLDGGLERFLKTLPHRGRKKETRQA